MPYDSNNGSSTDPESFDSDDVANDENSGSDTQHVDDARHKPTHGQMYRSASSDEIIQTSFYQPVTVDSKSVGRRRDDPPTHTAEIPDDVGPSWLRGGPSHTEIA